MILNHGLMFNRFGEEIENTTGVKTDATDDFITIGKLDAKLIDLKTEFQSGAKEMFTKIEDRVKKTDELIKAFTVDKNFISVGNKRIVSVARAINKNDVVIKSQTENMIKTSVDFINKRVTDHIQEFNKLKTAVDQHMQKFENYHTHIKDTIQEI